MSKLSELKLILTAIKDVRTNWLKEIETKFNELSQSEPQLNPNEVLGKVVLHPDVNEKYQRLINLYGTLGAEAGTYADFIPETPSNVIPLKKAG